MLHDEPTLIKISIEFGTKGTIDTTSADAAISSTNKEFKERKNEEDEMQEYDI